MAQKPKSPPPPAPAQTPPAPAPDYLDIDLAAALPPAPAPKPGRGRPRSAAPPPPRKYKIRKDKGIKKKKEPPPAPIDIYNIIGGSIDSSNIGEGSSATDLKAKMTVKELKFLEIYLAGNISQVNAVKAAGYEGYNERYYETLARRIIAKHEAQVGDGRILARAMGMGEVKVLQTLWELMQSKVERIRLDAVMYLGKILGLTREQVEGAHGITIIFEGAAPNLPASLALPVQPGEQAQAPTYPGRVLQITK